MSMTGSVDGERGSYPELVDALARHGAHATADAEALYRRMAFNGLVSNVDDHLRNHGFLWLGRNGWSLSPAYDLNPTPTDMKARILSTNINLDEGTCSICSCRECRGIFRTDAHCGAQRHPRSRRSGLALAGCRRRSRCQAA
jgi:serine/threonine-protein kinase HipA